MIPQEDPQITELYLKEKERLSWFPYFQRDPAHSEDGVLLSDRIAHYCKLDFRLIDPFDPECLRPAGYDLRVGANYAIGGKLFTLNEGGSLTIRPYQVAVIQTLETLNLPDFLIGRWNIRVALAYKGLLWVGGAQVDPGFRGRLSCPIYNLSTQDVTLAYGERLAMVDFVTTTPFKDIASKPFKWWDGKKLVFQQYATDLQSGVEDRLQNIQKELALNKSQTEGLLADAEKRGSAAINSIQTRIETFVTLIFAVVAALFTGLSIVATKGSNDPSFMSSTVWVAGIALYFALRPYVVIFERNRKDHDRPGEVEDRQHTVGGKWYAPLVPKPLELLIAGIVVGAGLAYHIWDAHISARDIREAREQAAEAIRTLNQEKADFAAQVRDLQQQAAAKIDNLQQQINQLRPDQSKVKGK